MVDIVALEVVQVIVTQDKHAIILLVEAKCQIVMKTLAQNVALMVNVWPEELALMDFVIILAKSYL